MYYSLIGTALTVIIGVVVSYFTQDPKDSYNAKLLHPLIFKLNERFGGDKPYYIKEHLDNNTTTTTNSVAMNCDGAKINHAFEPQNELSLTNKDEKLKKQPLDEVIFTVSPPTLPVTVNNTMQHVDIDNGIYRKMEST